MCKNSNVLTIPRLNCNEVIRIFQEDNKFILISTCGTFPIIGSILITPTDIQLNTDTDEGSIFIHCGWHAHRRYVYCVDTENYFKIKNFLLND